MSLTKDERTTTINMDDGDSPYAEIITYQRPWISYLQKHPDALLVEDLECSGSKGAIFMVPKELISKPRHRRKSGRKWTDEQRMAAGERLKKARAKD
jgi:hypothetical protein